MEKQCLRNNLKVTYQHNFRLSFFFSFFVEGVMFNDIVFGTLGQEKKPKK